MIPPAYIIYNMEYYEQLTEKFMFYHQSTSDYLSIKGILTERLRRIKISKG